MDTNKLEALARDPQTATLIGAATGAVKGALVGIAVGKLALCVTLGVVAGAATGQVVSRLARSRDALPALPRLAR